MFLAGAKAPAAPRPDPFGAWRNPDRSVVVKLQPCSDKLCGVIVWASPSAQAEARRAEARPLIGLELLRDYHRVSATAWRGTVYVPDMGRSFSSKLVQRDANTLEISGCVIAGLLCRHQQWQRA
ncbi:MAG: DUF2147 domain-containing protein [Novosphingobium sp.]|nr:DUF2147 domain-containing protein [Novosphingobium sp.]